MYGGYILSNLLMLNSKGDSFLLVDSDIMNPLITKKGIHLLLHLKTLSLQDFFAHKQISCILCEMQQQLMLQYRALFVLNLA
ncbi:hypothetical protein C9085_22030 [Escherichia coli]|nr:hypothetical protein DL800_15530 [Escherichia coli]EIL19152.1 hypothetical protein ECO9574_06996 [Escherichia coli O111:H8 str. CVM9574]EIL25758.1 hypothetical protein ECO9570_07239 [Escherichia coli O111:H8 str. CVM9570]RBB48821.1 hypothetical protein DQW51_19235 [Escherichia coli O111:H-]PDU31112.1 hypothetical protein A6V13_22590 [Escherichia coli]